MIANNCKRNGLTKPEMATTGQNILHWSFHHVQWKVTFLATPILNNDPKVGKMGEGIVRSRMCAKQKCSLHDSNTG